MRASSLRSGELWETGRRFNAGFYLSEDEEAVRRLRDFDGIKSSLGDLCEAVYSGPIFRKIPAENADHGVGYVSAVDLFKADVRPNGYLSRRHGALLDDLMLKPNTVLLTCSGMNLGKSLWVREDLSNLAGSGDLIRLVPDADKAPAGFVFAFLSSRYGVASVRRLIYGGHIKHISPADVSRISVPRLAPDTEKEADELIRSAAALRTEATRTLSEAISRTETEIDAPADTRGTASSGHAVRSCELASSFRFDAFYHNQVATDLDGWIRSHRLGSWCLGEIASVFDVPPFKHIYVAETHGVPFFTSGELFLLDRRANKHLSRRHTRGLEKYIIKDGWVLLARSGQLGGIIGRPQMADSSMRDVSTSDHVVRIVATSSNVPAGYILAYLSTPHVGYHLLTRTMTGASVPALWPKYLNQVRVLRCSDDFMIEIDRLVVGAFEMKVLAAGKEQDARSLVERAIEEAG